METLGIKSLSLRMVLKTMLSAGVPIITISGAYLKKEEALFLDCREREEFDVSHLPGAEWVGYEDFDFNRLPKKDEAQPIIAYCSIGKRSNDIAKKLLEAGYENVQNLAGGIFEWVNQGHAVYRNGTETNNIHAFNRFWGRWVKKGNKVY